MMESTDSPWVTTATGTAIGKWSCEVWCQVITLLSDSNLGSLGFCCNPKVCKGGAQSWKGGCGLIWVQGGQGKEDVDQCECKETKGRKMRHSAQEGRRHTRRTNLWHFLPAFSLTLLVRSCREEPKWLSCDCRMLQWLELRRPVISRTHSVLSHFLLVAEQVVGNIKHLVTTVLVAVVKWGPLGC